MIEVRAEMVRHTLTSLHWDFTGRAGTRPPVRYHSLRVTMILMYHKVAPETPTMWWVAPEVFARQLESLRHRRFVYLDDYSSPDTEAVVTFDDAYENVHRYALPVLAAQSIPFEVFVIGNRVGAWNEWDPGEPPTRHMTDAQLQDVVRSQGRLQWHTHSHPELNLVETVDIERELQVPADLRRRFEPPHFTWFSYPGGSFDSRVLRLARQHFAGAVSVFQGDESDRWQLNRFEVLRDTPSVIPDSSRPCL